MNTSESHPPLPPFTRESAAEKVRLAENGWNSRNPEKVALVYTVDSWWRNRSEFIQGRPAIIELLTRKWQKEFGYRLIKELWAFDGSRIAVRFAYEWHDASGSWFRSYGNENWEFGADGLMPIGTPPSTMCRSRKWRASSTGTVPARARAVDDLRRKLLRYIRHYNKTATPIKWTYSTPAKRINA